MKPYLFESALFTLADLARDVPHICLMGDEQTPILRVHTDSRNLCSGDLFVALRGERFDAHDFLPQVKSSKASAVLVERDLEIAQIAGVQVADSRLALAQLAKAWREKWSSLAPLIAVTGSNGKTTVTQMIAAVLRAQFGEQSLATEGNFNNDIGVPLTLLRLRSHHLAAVVELGMNHIGEIAYLADCVQPNIALVNNAQREHQEFMGTVEAVALENGQVLAALPKDKPSFAVFPADELYADLWTKMAGSAQLMRFSADKMIAAEIVLQSAHWQEKTGAWNVCVQTPKGTIDYVLRLPGIHNVRNSLAVIAASLAANVSLSALIEGLGAFLPVKGRSKCWVQTYFADSASPLSLTIVDDTYNANPDSVRAAIDLMLDLPEPRLLILGDMAEVGDQGEAFHAEVGAYAKSKQIDALVTLGDLCFFAAKSFENATHFQDLPSLLNHLSIHSIHHSNHLKNLDNFDHQLNNKLNKQFNNQSIDLSQYRSILVKGSRFMQMERVIDYIQNLK